jgi:hypothetical protein
MPDSKNDNEVIKSIDGRDGDTFGGRNRDQASITGGNSPSSPQQSLDDMGGNPFQSNPPTNQSQPSTAPGNDTSSSSSDE